MKSTDQLMLSIGAVLATERERRGIPVEKAAKETRMRPQRIRDMESDDLSHFTNPSYARMFIIAYAKYLGIPMQTIMDHLPDRGEPGSEDYQYITASTNDLPSLRRDLISRPLRRHSWLPVVAIISILGLLVAGGITITIILVNLPRLAPAPDAQSRREEPPPPPNVVTETVYRIENLRLANLPDPSPTPVDPIAPSPGPAPASSAPASFTQEARIAAPPKPAPIVIIGEQPSTEPTTLESAVPTASPAEDEDRAFLLGSSPDQKIPAR